MKIISQFSSVLAGLVFLQSILADANTDEVLEMKVFNPNFRASDKEIYKMLEKANLTGRGYKKEVTTRVVQGESGKTDYQKMYFIYRDVDCSKLQEVEKELGHLLPELLGKDVKNKFEKEVKYRHLNNMRECKAGLEVHFLQGQGCSDDNQKAVTKRRKKRLFDCWFCKGCVVAKAK